MVLPFSLGNPSLATGVRFLLSEGIHPGLRSPVLTPAAVSPAGLTAPSASSSSFSSSSAKSPSTSSRLSAFLAGETGEAPARAAGAARSSGPWLLSFFPSWCSLQELRAVEAASIFARCLRSSSQAELSWRSLPTQRRFGSELCSLGPGSVVISGRGARCGLSAAF